MTARAPAWRTIIPIALGAGLGYAVLGLHPDMLSDEGFHVSQAKAFFDGQLVVLRGTAMVPGYHAALALVERVFGHHGVIFLRFINLVGSLLLPWLVWRLVAVNAALESGRRAVQWFFMPLLFPLYFLVYTDAWALVAVLAMFDCTLRRRHVLAALVAAAATLLRQDMIVWAGMAWILAVVGDGDLARWRAGWRERLRPGLQRGLPLLIVLLAFVVFYVWNGGVAVGDRERQSVRFNLTNVACLLLCAWLVFLPQNLAAVPRIRGLLRRPICIALLLAGFALYMGTYANDHEFNSSRLRYFLHNEWLYWLTESPWLRAAAFVPMAWMALTATVTDLAAPRLRIVYFFALLAAGLHPLIEQRYYLPALTLFQVWRGASGARYENAMLVLYAIATTWIVWGIASGRFFP
jgi:alpha-1,2-glucosyltransferase